VPGLQAPAFLAVHPQKIQPAGTVPAPADGERNRVQGRIRSATYKGAETELVIDADLGPLIAAVARPQASAGESVAFCWSARQCAVGPQAA
jgi:hypothetical protein